MSSAAEEAIQRAKEIAARLSGTAAPAPAAPTASDPLDVANAAQAALAAVGNGDSSSSKRKRWGVSGEDTTAAALPGLENMAKRLKQATVVEPRRVWVSTNTRPASHFMLYLSQGDKLNGIASIHPTLKVELKGRGSSRTAPPPGMPEEPLHVLIQGEDQVAVTQAETMVEDLLRQAETASLQQDAIVPTSSTEAAAPSPAPGYTPAPVAALIHGHPGAGQMLEEQIGVPNGLVGFIIGRGGMNITGMQQRTGCKVQIQKEHEMAPGQTQRVITLTASSKQAIDECRGIIENMVTDRIRETGSMASSTMSAPSGGNTQQHKLNEAISAGHALVTIAVPDGDVGLIIGRGGMTIRNIQDRSGANIQIPQVADADNPATRTVSITHPHVEGANVAKQLIEEMLATKTQNNQSGPYTSIQVAIPDKDVGMCIGRSGCVIREMQNKTGTQIQIPSQAQPGQEYRYATVSGPAEGCNQVKQMIERISLEQSSQSVMSGAAYQAHDQYGGGQQYGGYGQEQYGQQQYGGAYGQQPYAAGGQQDYSAEWAAYYAAQAAAGGGAATGQAAAAATPAPAASTQTGAAPSASGDGQQGADAYYEQFFRYAYYYGEAAAREYYKTWSPPVGTPNPYGENPAGITPAPAADSNTTAQPAPAPATASQPAPAQAPAASSEAASQARETSQRRGVSNLPAWMTQGSS
jgi:far upstream element-binding protein